MASDPFSTEPPDEEHALESVRPLEEPSETESDRTALRAAGVLVLRETAAGQTEVALLRRQGTVCLPRVFLHPTEATRAAAERAMVDQVQAHMVGTGWRFVTRLFADFNGSPLATDYWRTQASDSDAPLLTDCFWTPLAVASTQLAFPEERQLLMNMDPLTQTQEGTGAQSKKEGAAAPASLRSALQSRWPQGPHRAHLAQSIAATRASVESSGPTSDWRAHALERLDQADDAVRAGRLDAAQEALTQARRLDLEARSVAERRLMTQLLRGDVRENTDGWLRDTLLTALQENPDAGTMALVRGELERQTRRNGRDLFTHDQGRLAQILVTVPVALWVYFAFQHSWVTPGSPTDGNHVLPAMAFGLFGGVAWSLFHAPLRSIREALIPLVIGAFTSLLGFLLAKSGILTFGEDSAPLALATSILWGIAGAAFLSRHQRKI
ncbi:MAG: hypothetical protein KDB61_03400 [Planctomycetes bacterium]|nr:hypothetical protein [Planctomycetota bacterium]